MHLDLSPGTLGKPVSTASDVLTRLGFTSTEIARLTELRDRCALIEFLDAAELEQLAFLKWRYENGRLGGPAADEGGEAMMT